MKARCGLFEGTNPFIISEGLRKTKKIFSEDSQCPISDSNSAHPERWTILIVKNTTPKITQLNNTTTWNSGRLNKDYVVSV
jgi:hypothetical protein